MLEPYSFEELKKSFLKKHPDSTIHAKVINVPVYLVNKVSGQLGIYNDALFFNGSTKGEFCCIHIPKLQFRHFSVRDEDKHKAYLVNIIWGKFYTGNYELFLKKNDAIHYSVNILSEKKKKLDEKINRLIAMY